MELDEKIPSLGCHFVVCCACSGERLCVAIAGCSGSNERSLNVLVEGLDASQVKDDDLKTLNVGSDLYPPFVYTDEYSNRTWMSRY